MAPKTRHAWGLAGIFTATFLLIAAFSYESPVEALRLHDMGASNMLVALVTNAWAVAIVVGGPLHHGVLSRLGPLRTLIMAFIGTSLCSLGAGLYPDPLVWGVLRFISGLFFGPAWALLEAWINTLARPEARARTTATYVIICGLAFTLAPLMLNVVGPDGALPFFLSAAVIVLALVPLLTLRGLPAPHDDDSSPPLIEVVRQFPLIIMLGTVAGFAEQVPLGLFPLFALGHGQSVAALTSAMAVIGLGKLVFTVPLGMVADRLSVGLTLAAGSLLSAGLALGIGLAADAGWLFYLLAFAWGATLDLFYALGLAMIGGKFAPAHFAAANTVFIMMYAVGGFTGTIGTGAMMDWVGPLGYALTIALVFTTLAALLVYNRPALRGE